MTPRDDWSGLRSIVQNDWPTHRWTDTGIVVGCSGGADSTALLIVLSEIMSDFGGSGFVIAAHCNHALRGDESDGDLRFVRELAKELKIQFVAGDGSAKSSAEADLRDIRLQFLEQAAHHAGARYVALAHNADDQVETFFHHLMRGTGPAGLTGMARHRDLGEDLVLVRPMLGIRRESIRTALQECQQTWREDSSNQSREYTRNWIRGELIPLMETRFPLAADAVGRTIESLSGWSAVIDHLADQWLTKHVSDGQGRTPASGFADEVVVSLRRDARLNTDSAVVIRALQMLWDRQNWPRGSMSSRHWQLIANRWNDDATRDPIDLPGGVRLSDDGEGVLLTGP